MRFVVFWFVVVWVLLVSFGCRFGRLVVGNVIDEFIKWFFLVDVDL